MAVILEAAAGISAAVFAAAGVTSVTEAGIMLRQFTGVAVPFGPITDREGSAERRDIGKRLKGSQLAAAPKSD